MKRYRKRKYYKEDEALFVLFLLGFLFLYSLLKKYWIYLLIIFGLIILYLIIRKIIDLDLKSDFKKTKIYHTGKHGENWLKQLEENNDIRAKTVKAGIWGEKKLLHSLEYSDIPMYILYDLVLECDGYRSQIDVVAVTKRNIYFLESKNLRDNIVIEKDGTVTRKLGKYKKGIKNPLTQNNEHKLVIDAIFKKEKIKDSYQSWVILTNDESYVNYKKSDENYRTTIMRNDKLIENMKKKEKKSHLKRQENGIKLICDALLKYDVNQEIDIRTDEEIINELKSYRRQKSAIEGVDAYIIFNDETLMELVAKKPKNEKELFEIKGFGEIKVKKYGNEIIDLINNKN